MDEALKGFGVLVGASTKTYVAQRDMGGRTVRVTLGRHGVITTAQAKREAEEAIGLMRRGINPNEQKRAAHGRSITLQEAADLYLAGNKPRAAKTMGAAPATTPASKIVISSSSILLTLCARLYALCLFLFFRPSAYCLQLTSYCLLFTAVCLLFTVFCDLSSAAYFLLPTACYSLPFTRRRRQP